MESVDYAGFDGLSCHVGLHIITEIILHAPYPDYFNKEYEFYVKDDKTVLPDYIWGQI